PRGGSGDGCFDRVAIGTVVPLDDTGALVRRQRARELGEEPRVTLRAVEIDEEARRTADERRGSEPFREGLRDLGCALVIGAMRVERPLRGGIGEERSIFAGHRAAAVLA